MFVMPAKGRAVRMAFAFAVVAALALAVPTIASATTFNFKPNQLENGSGFTQSNTVQFSAYPVWYFDISDGVSSSFMTDADGWAMKPLYGWVIPGVPTTSVPFSQVFVVGGYGNWWMGGFDVRNTGTEDIELTVSATAGGAPVSSTVVIEPGVEHVSLSGFEDIANWGAAQISFALTDKLSFNNFDLGEYYGVQSPVVSTGATSNLSTTGASVAGTVSWDGGSSVSERGIVWSTSPNPTTMTGTKVPAGSGAGSFSASLTGLSGSTTYYARAYATNFMGTSYGSQVTFTTSAAAVAPPAIRTDATSPWAMTLLAVGGLGVAAVARKKLHA